MKYLLLTILALGLVSFALLVKSPTETQVPSIAKTDTVLHEIKPKSEPVSRWSDTLTLKEKIGQMLLIGYWGADANTKLLPLIEEGLVGTVMLMKGTVGTTEAETAAAVGLLKGAINADAPPLLIAIDQEGGVVSRLPEANSDTAQPNISTKQKAYDIAHERGARLHALGIDINFAPVLEHITNKDSFLFNRTFRGNREDIAELGIAMVRGYHDAGVIAVPKHFPGHTNASVDSHHSLPTVPIQSESELLNIISPFTETLSTTSVHMLMNAHVQYPYFDATYPASLSTFFITDLLRGKLGFEGLVITDDLNMGAITTTLTREEALIQAIHAGNDILLFVVEPSELRAIHQKLFDLVVSGKISEERINESVARIETLKLFNN